MTTTATYSEASAPGGIELADALGRTPKRGSRRRTRGEWPTGGANVRIPLLPISGDKPCQKIGDPDEWTGERHPRKELKAACADCPARARCLAYALKWDVAGIWGGTLTRERRALRRKAGLPTPLPVQLGRDPLDLKLVPVTNVPDKVFLDVTTGHYDALQVDRDERHAAAAVRAASPASTNEPEWDDNDPLQLLVVMNPDLEAFAACCSYCCRKGQHDLVTPYILETCRLWKFDQVLASYTCGPCGFEWKREWASRRDAVNSARSHEANLRATRRSITKTFIGQPLTEVVTRFGSRIRSVTTDDDGCVTSIDIR